MTDALADLRAKLLALKAERVPGRVCNGRQTYRKRTWGEVAAMVRDDHPAFVWSPDSTRRLANKRSEKRLDRADSSRENRKAQTGYCKPAEAARLLNGWKTGAA